MWHVGDVLRMALKVAPFLVALGAGIARLGAIDERLAELQTRAAAMADIAAERGERVAGIEAKLELLIQFAARGKLADRSEYSARPQ